MTKGGATVAYVVDADNRMKEIRQTTTTGPLQNSFVYDDDGNLTTKERLYGTRKALRDVVKLVDLDLLGNITSIIA